MKKRGKISIFGVVVILIGIIAIVHTIFQFAFFGTGIKGLSEKGISGLAIQAVGWDKNFPLLSPTSNIILGVEWGILIIAVIVSIAVEKINARKENITLDVKSIARGKSKTDLDVLYDVLKDKKKLKISTIMKLFNINEETANEWAKILESGNLITINYPRIGETELIVTEPKTAEPKIIEQKVVEQRTVEKKVIGQKSPNQRLPKLKTK